MFRSCLILTLFSLGSFAQLPTSAQDTSCLHRTLALNVEDSTGLPVQGLTPTDFQAKLRAGPAKILSIVPDDRPHRLVILIDASGSMTMFWGQALASALALAETPLHNVQMALLVFGQKVYEQIDFSRGQSAVADRLREFRAGAADPIQLVHGRTAILDALLSGLQLLDAPTSADSLYLLTDGAENASRTHLDDVAHRLTSSGVRLFVSFVGTRSGVRPRTSEEIFGPVSFSQLVRKTGGGMIQPFADGVPTNPKDGEKLAEVVNAFHQKMIHNFRLEIELPGPLDKWHEWELKLSGGNKNRWKNVRVAYPTELAPCGP